MEQAVESLETIFNLNAAEEPGPCILPQITALVVVPGLGERLPHEAPHLVKLRASPWTRAQATLCAGQHMYSHGLSYRRTHKGRTRVISKYDTDIYVLSNMAVTPSGSSNYQMLIDVVSCAFKA